MIFFPYLSKANLKTYKNNTEKITKSISLKSNSCTDKPIDVPAAGTCSEFVKVITSKQIKKDIPEKI